MTVSEALEQVKFVVGADGQPTAAMLDIELYRALVTMLEEAEVVLDVRERKRGMP